MNRTGIEAYEVISIASINTATSNCPSIRVGTRGKGIYDDGVVASTGTNGGIIVDTNGIGTASVTPPPPVFVDSRGSNGNSNLVSENKSSLPNDNLNQENADLDDEIPF